MTKYNNTCVVAGAGAGKTYTLVQEYMFAVLGLDGTGVVKDPREVMAVTFTAKAALEMRERVAERLAALLESPNDDEGVNERLKNLESKLPNQQTIKKLLNLLPQAPICTFHSFCGDLLRTYALEAGINSEYALIEPNEEHTLLSDVAEKVIIDNLRNSPKGFQNLITTFQLKRLGDAQGLVDMLMNIYHKMCEHGANAQDIHLANSYNLDSNSLENLTADISSDIAAYHSHSVRLTEKAGDKLKLVINSLDVLNKILKDNFKSDKPNEIAISFAFNKARKLLAGRFGPDELRKNLVHSVSLLGAWLCDYFTAPNLKLISNLLSQFSLEVDKIKNEQNCLGFGDLLLRTQKLLKNNKEVRRELQGKYKKILVDEFQDTSPLQEDLVALLCEDSDNKAQAQNNNKRLMGSLQLAKNKLFLVGDPKQSIYGFRGADAQLFIHTLNVVVEQGGDRKSLDLCRRSQGDIIDLVNHIAQETISEGKDGVEFKESDKLGALRPHQGSAGAIWRTVTKTDKEVENNIKPIDCVAKTIAQGVFQKIQAGEKLSDFVVLVRRIKIAQQIIVELKKLGLNSRVYGGTGFFERYEIFDMLAFLKLVCDPTDELATMTVLRSGFLNLSDAELLEIISQNSDWNGGVSWGLVGDKFGELELIRQHLKKNLNNLSFGDLINYILEHSCYLEKLFQCEDADLRLANINKLKTLYVSFGDSNLKHINKLWKLLDKPPKESLATVESMGESTDNNYLEIMTIHQSKGLEFKNVICADTYATMPSSKDIVAFDPEVGLALSHLGRPIANCAPKNAQKKDIPTGMDRVRLRQKERGEAELSRLLYVALTRARDTVYWTDVYEDGKPLKSRGACLNDLFFKAYNRHAQKLEKILPVVLSQPAGSTERSDVQLNEQGSREKRPEINHPPIIEEKYKKISPSGLEKLPSSQDIKPLVTPYSERSKPERLVRGPIDSALLADPTSCDRVAIRNDPKSIGTLAHKLIAQIGQLASSEDLGDQNFLEKKLEAYLKLEQQNHDRANYENLLTACLKTLTGPIKDLIIQNYQLNFEYPISYELDSGDVVEGSVDLIAERDNELIIIDFKSSVKACESENTQGQLNAYAEYFRRQNKYAKISLKPILIGAG